MELCKLINARLLTGGRHTQTDPWQEYQHPLALKTLQPRVDPLPQQNAEECCQRNLRHWDPLHVSPLWSRTPYLRRLQLCTALCQAPARAATSSQDLAHPRICKETEHSLAITSLPHSSEDRTGPHLRVRLCSPLEQDLGGASIASFQSVHKRGVA